MGPPLLKLRPMLPVTMVTSYYMYEQLYKEPVLFTVSLSNDCFFCHITHSACTHAVPNATHRARTIVVLTTVAMGPRVYSTHSLPLGSCLMKQRPMSLVRHLPVHWCLMSVAQSVWPAQSWHVISSPAVSRSSCWGYGYVPEHNREGGLVS